MLKIKDGIDLKQLEKFGFEYKDFYDDDVYEFSVSASVMQVKRDRCLTLEGDIFDEKEGNQYLNVIYSLIKADMVEKVENKMRDKLIELHKQAQNDWLQKAYEHETDKGLAEYVADHLIENNVFVLPEQMKDSWELCSGFITRMFVADESEIEKIKGVLESQKINQILTDIRDYLVAIIDEWHKRIDEPNFYEQNIVVYNHIRKELDDLTEYAEKLGVEL